jgi:ankyrin repeat protein
MAEYTPSEKKFIEALEKGDLDTVDVMLSAGEARVTLPVTSSGDQPIHLAAGKGNPDLIELLVRHGADINALEVDKETPLMVAARWGMENSVRKLVELGALLDLRDKGGYTAIFRAAMDNRAGVIDILTTAGADPNIATDSGLTALFGAALRGHMAAAKSLVDGGARLEQKGHGLSLTEFAEMVSRSGGDSRLVSDFLSATKLGQDAHNGTAEKTAVMKPLSFKKPSA